MMCPDCGMRYAPFPEKDYIFTEDAITAVKEDADVRRMEVYNDDTVKPCGCVEEEGGRPRMRSEESISPPAYRSVYH